jgi:2,4-dienoyl-CoA reductase-like NADH-dependent reductase (Old Yellow Enzyme family)
MTANLFSPLRIGRIELANRAVMSPLSSVLARDRLPGEAHAAFYARRAEGGVGMIVTEGLRVHPTNCAPTAIGTFEPDCVRGLARIAARVHEHRVPVIAQLLHGGRQTHLHSPQLLWAPSAVPCLYSGYTPHEMSLAEVEQMRDHFVLGAQRAEEAGFDGVELHAAQGHLAQQFLSPLSNHRNDRYGGDFDRRLAFVCEVLDAIRARCGTALIVGVRLASTEFVPGGLDVAASAAIAAALESRTTIDYVALSQSNFMSIAGHIPDRREPPLPYIEHAREVRAALKRVPVIATGRIRTPEEADAVIANGDTDAVGLGRALLSDPDWVAKASRGEADRIRRCIYCNVCWQTITNGQGITCVQNPQAGRESVLGNIARAPEAKRVVVVGGGPAGLAAASAAAQRGHAVVLFERASLPGGQLRWAARIPGDGETANVIDYLAGEVRRLGVQVRLGEEATVETVLAMSPDTVIIATGSTAHRALFPHAADVPVLAATEAIDQLASSAALPWSRVIVLDRDLYFATGALAEWLAARGAKVHLVSFHQMIGHDLPAANLTRMLGRLDALGVSTYPAHDLARIDRQSAVLRHAYSEREKDLGAIDAVVVSGLHRADDRLALALRAVQPALEVRVVGDALAPRSIKDAVHEGERAGREI